MHFGLHYTNSNAAQSQGVDTNFGFNHIQNYIKQINATLLNNEIHEKLNTTKFSLIHWTGH